MRKVAFFVLTLITIVIADDKDIEDIAKRFDTDAATVQTCLDEIGIKIAELSSSFQKWSEIKDDDINEETKESLMKYNRFLGCMLEKNGMIVDSKLVVDKILESMEKDKDLIQPSQKEVLTECINSLNEDSEMTQEDRVFGLMLCLVNNQIDGETT